MSPPARSSSVRASNDPAWAASSRVCAPARCRWRTARSSRGCRSRTASARYDAQVADLGADPERAAVELAVEDQPAADAGADRDQQQVVDVVAGAVGELAPRGGVGVVLDHDREVEPGLELGLEVDVAPREVGREQHRGTRLVDVAGRADPDADDGRGWRPAGPPARRSRPRSPPRRVAGDSTRSCSRMLPSSSTTPPAILVPPTSIPHARLILPSSGQASSSRSMCSTPSPRAPAARRSSGTAVASIPAAACISDAAATARWVATSGLVWRMTCTVRQIGQ